MTALLDRLSAIVGDAHVLSGDAIGRYALDWADRPQGRPLAALRPGSTGEVASILRLANETGTPVVPMSGNTGLTGGTAAEGALVVSLERMRAIREIRPQSRVAVVEAGAILSSIHEAADAHDLIFPLFFGARGSAMIGGALSTNAGGSNVLRYGNTRDLCLGIEAVLPTGRVVNLMSQLHKDNSGYNLKHLLIGAEGTLGIITAATLRLFPKPRAYATATVAARDLPAALALLNRLQEETSRAVEAFEYMPAAHIDAYLALHPDVRPPFDERHAINILVELGATAPRDATPDAGGTLPIAARLEEALAEAFEAGEILDAVVAQSDSQRQEMWARREASAEVCKHNEPLVHNDVAVPIDSMPELLDTIGASLARHDPGARDLSVAHLGDGNLHFAGALTTDDPAVHDAIYSDVVEAVVALGGSFSAEHGIGLEKRASMARFKDPAALDAMRAIKDALDPNGILNPGKVLPET
ncbi:FAD-binding oxidoreductase [Roseovarius sp. SCSIO 43702]|uniref:FAD-binding oxidoreductase n=1 Tax=Roseovarius sp. SCSIO 43702 TaxID=2823043 RepID=UPI001C730474|nr:FAD-binding oxidoreductase [Roseovarius sp. SCSIO 43702]QYX57716.1 FAD-binding oxidoreductase [Roseovarius sp. SCSIO 43702]